jgi:tryptophanyl-tRNA synthetase
LPAVTIAQTSDFLIDPVYVELLFGLFKTISTTAARNARPAAMKDYIVSEKLISLVSLAMQCADVFYMKADTVFSDPSQRHIYELLSDASPALLPATMPDFVYVPVACDLRGRHIFESTSATRITIHDDRHTVAQKVGKMYAPPVGQDIEPGREHALHAYFRWSVFPWRSHPVALDCEDGVRRQIADFETYLELYEGGLLHPRSCKLTLAEALSERIAGISERMDHSTFSWIRGIQQPPSCAAPNLAMIGAQ